MMRHPEVSSLVASRYLRHVRTRTGYVMYHALHGRPVVINPPAFRLVSDLKKHGRLDGPRQASTDGVDRTSVACLQHLQDRGLLVAAGTDERAQRRVQFEELRTTAPATRLRAMCLVVSEACNLSCAYCITAKVYRRASALRQPVTAMSWETARHALDIYSRSLAAVGADAMRLNLNGGEPLLRPRLILRILDYVERIRRDPASPIRQYYIAINTNGTLLTEDFARSLSRYSIGHVSVSLDGFEDVHNRMRPSSLRTGAFKRTVTGIRALRAGAPDVDLAVSATLRAENLDGIGEPFLDFVKDLGARVVRLDPDFLDDFPVSVDEMVDRVVALRRMIVARGMIPSASWEDPYQALFVDESPFRCAATNGRHVCVRPDGGIYPCQYAGYRLGDISRFEAAFDEAPFRRMVEENYSGLIPECRGCAIEGLCRGGCYSARLFDRTTGQASHRRRRCRFFRGVFRAIVRDEADN